MRPTLALLLAALPLAACVPPNEALHNATLSTAPGAPGFLVIGLAEQNYRWDLASWTQSLSLTLLGPDRQPVTIARRGCGSITGLVGEKPCDLSQIDHIVLQLQPGAWTPTDVVEAYHFPDGDHTLRATAPSTPITIRSGQITYAGDYTFASNADAQTIQLARHSRDDAAAQRALSPFTNLRSTPVSLHPQPVTRGQAR